MSVEGSQIQHNILLGPLTTFGIGGSARYFVHANSGPDVIEALDFAKVNGLPIFVLGGGSNLLISDAGFSGLVLKIGLKGLTLEPSGDRVLMLAEAGEDWDGMVRRAIQEDLAGIECLSGIPGSVGGTPVQNVGAYGQETADVLVAVRVLDRRDEIVRELSHDDCGFAYRSSIFNTTERDRYIVLGVTYALKKGGAPGLGYADVRRRFESSDHPPTLSDVRQAILEIRGSKAMLISPGDPDSRSAGSFFKNPIISQDGYARLQDSIREAVPRYPAPAGQVKTSAAWLIERAGCARGFAMGPAAISSKHTLALVNRGGATAADIIRLGREIRARVEDRFGIRLAPEPVFLGFDEPF